MLENKVKSVFQRLRRTAGLAVLGLPGMLSGCVDGACGTDADCPGTELCVSGTCSGGCNKDTDCPGNEVCTGGSCTAHIKPVPINYGTSNERGQVFFTDSQTGEAVTVNVKDESGNPIPRADVVFWDGDGFETYQARADGFVPYLHIFAHNSAQELVMKGGEYFCEKYDGDTKVNSWKAAKEFSEHVKRIGTPGCVRREDLHKAVNSRINSVMSLTDYAGEIGDYVSPFLVCAKAAIVDIPYSFYENNIEPDNPCPAYNTWGHHAQDTIDEKASISSLNMLLGCMSSIPAEIPNNGIDDNCDGIVDGMREHSCTNQCNTVGSECNGSGFYITCGDFDNDGCLEWNGPHRCNGDTYCEDGRCVDRQQDCTSHGSIDCYQDDVYWFDSCGNPEEVRYECTGGKKCSAGSCECILGDYKECSDGNVNWFDSCGNRQGIEENCESGCENGSCVERRQVPGWCEDSGGYWAQDGLGGVGCWIATGSRVSCDVACEGVGLSCDEDGWNDNENCSVCRHFFPVVNACQPSQRENAPYAGVFADGSGVDCYYRDGGSQDCSTFLQRRLCVCE